MLLNLRNACVFAFIIGSPLPALAWNPFKAAGEAIGGTVEAGGRRLGKGLGEGAVEALQPALVSTVDTASRAASGLVADVDVRLTRQVDHVGGVASKLVSETKGALDDSLERVDRILEKRLLQVQTTAEGLVERLDGAVERNLHIADRILKERSDQLGRIMSDSIGQADRALEARISQLDEDVALRLGNVDVIATKQRLGLEETVIRAGVLLALLVFVVFVLRTLWKEYAVVKARTAARRGIHRTVSYFLGLARPIVFPTVAALAAVLVLYGLYDRLPLGARARAAELASMHRREMNASLARFDFSRVRFHASQLEILLPDQGAYYQAMANKAALLRDLVLRPAMLATEQGVGQVVERVGALERQLGRRADPDLLTMKALVLWQVGDTKRDEHAAASYCARALRFSPGGFALAPLARHYIRTFLEAPFLAEGTLYGRDAESLQDLRALAGTSAEVDAGFPLAPMMDLDRLITELDRKLVPAYLDMLNAQARLVSLLPDVRRGGRERSPSEDALAARKQRTEAAQRVLGAWRDFESQIAQTPSLAGKSTVLAIFRLNDASYTRAAWFVEKPEENRLAPVLSEIADLKLRKKLAPPRIGWEKRYGSLIAQELHSVAELQEANRFVAFENLNRDFERVYVAQLASVPSPERDKARREAAILAGKLGLFVPVAGERDRVPLARVLAGQEPSADKQSAQALAEALQTRGLRTL